MAGRTRPVEQRSRRSALHQPERLEFLQGRDGANSCFARDVVPCHPARSHCDAGASAPSQDRTSAKARGELNGDAPYASVLAIAGSGALCFRAFSQFSNRCTTTKNVGTNSTARQVEASMLENTVSRSASP